ncbi:MAG: tRNA lysidine(34) synthetase TilS [Sedimentisphaerales bacterium]|nr:tRNA lysidine(34) synthetase TilS [Sedimentisphaerales bacterium]
MLSEFEKKIADFIKANELYGSADKVLLAVSGGADSTALLHAISALSSENIFRPELLCAHINHQLRTAQSDSDEDFVIEQAARLKLAIKTKRVDVREFAAREKLSIETAARQLRIKNLIEIAKADNCRTIATAHQKNDNAETLLQRLSRGTGFRGLGGIWPKRIFHNEFKFIRPLLCVDRNEIIQYLQHKKLKWRQDHTNADCTYRRNYIRHRLLPQLQQDCAGSLVERLSELSESARGFYKLICRNADDIWLQAADCAGEKVTLDVKILLAQPQPVIVELLRRSLKALGCGERNLSQYHYENLFQLAQQNTSGKKIDLPGQCVANTEYGKIIFSAPEKISLPTELLDKSTTLDIPGQTRFGRYSIEATVFQANEKEFKKFKSGKNNFIEWFDFNKIKPPLFIRLRKAGDRFIPLGLSQEKKVGKFLTAARLPQNLRKQLLIVTDCEKIIWLWPIRISEKTKVTCETRKILQLRITDIPKIKKNERIQV